MPSNTRPQSAGQGKQMRSGRLYLSKTTRARLAVIKQTWRVLAAVAVFGIVGSILGWLLHPWFDPFHNAWIGGAVAAPIGFLVGLWWQLSNRERRRRTPVLFLVGLGLLVLIGSLIGAVSEIPWQRAFARRLNAFTSLPQNSLKRITFWDKYGRDELLTIRDENALRDFVLACRDSDGYSPNHPRYNRSWYVVLEGEQTIELMCHYESLKQDKVVGYFVRKQGDWTRYYGSFTSENLRPWFKKYVEPVPSSAQKD